MAKSNALLGTNIPFVQAHHVGRKQRPTAIVLRTSFTTGEAGAANGIAQAWHNPNNKVDSCHYVIDEFQVLRCVPDKIEAKSVSTSIYKNSITINVCYDPSTRPLDQVVFKTAKQVARLCKLYGIRVALLDDDQKLRWLHHQWRRRGGIIMATVGDFPTDEFFSIVKTDYERFR